MNGDLFFDCCCGLPECEPCRANTEIERLQAENQRLTDENARAWNACGDECKQKERLQALIDAWEDGRRRSHAYYQFHTGATQDDMRAFINAQDALRAEVTRRP